MRAHSKAKPLFDLAQPFSYLMQSIEMTAFNDAAGASLLYNIVPPNNVQELNAEVVIDQYGLATGRDAKATSVMARTVVAPRPAPAVAPARAAPALRAGNGRVTNVPTR